MKYKVHSTSSSDLLEDHSGQLLSFHLSFWKASTLLFCGSVSTHYQSQKADIQ